MPTKLFDRLAELASEQHGYVTQADARRLGIASSALVKMAKRGGLERMSFGLYRIALFPNSQLDPYMEATLWPSGVRAVISHESALSLYELSNVSPVKIHICVPAAHRPRRDVPPMYQLHREDLVPDEITAFDGVPIVTAEKAIMQTHKAAIGPDLLKQAIDDAYKNGLINKRKAAELLEKIGL